MKHASSGPASAEPSAECARCPRLADHRRALAKTHPDWWNRPVPAWGDPDARVLIVGLAPGRMGAHRTGRVFTGDASGRFLFDALVRSALAAGRYDKDGVDDLRPVGCQVTNAVRCLPPENRPTAAEIATCRPFLAAEIAGLPRLAAILCLGGLAHGAVLRTLDARAAAYPFAHGAEHRVGALRLFDSYHPSRLNVNTGRLTAEMFDTLLAKVARAVDL